VERITKAQAVRDNSMTLHMVPKTTTEVNPKQHSIMAALKKKAFAECCSAPPC